MTVKRYCKDGYHAEHTSGPLVAFDEYAKLQALVENLEKRNANLASRAAAYHNETLKLRVRSYTWKT